MKEKNSPIDYIEAKESRWEHDAAAKKTCQSQTLLAFSLRCRINMSESLASILVPSNIKKPTR